MTKKKDISYGAIAIPPDVFLGGGVQYTGILKWSFVYTYAKAIELLTNPFQTMDQKAFPFNVTIQTLSKILTPVVDEEFKRRVRAINKKFLDRYSNTPKFWFDAAYGLEYLEAIMELMDRTGILTTEPPKYQIEVLPDEVLEEIFKE